MLMLDDLCPFSSLERADRRDEVSLMRAKTEGKPSFRRKALRYSRMRRCGLGEDREIRGLSSAGKVTVAVKTCGICW